MACAALACGLLASCSSAQDDSTGGQEPDAGEPGAAGVTVRFELGDAPMRFGAMPWPDDLYRDAEGRVQVRGVPASDAGRAYVDALAQAASELDGFGLGGPVYFFVDGAVDPFSLPTGAEASLAQDASVFLLDVDTNSAEAFSRVPVQVSWQPSLEAVVLQPAAGHALVPGRRYAAVLTAGVRDEEGTPVGASARYARVRDAQRGLEDPLEQRLRASHAPVLETLQARGFERERIAGLSVFTVQTAGTELADAHAALLAMELRRPLARQALDASALPAVLGSVPPGTLGVDERGAPYDHVGWMIHGALEVPSFVSASVAAHGAFERDELGALRIKRMGEVPFTLWLPLGSAKLSELPVVVFQHDLLGDRSDALALANALAARGLAVIAMDAPFHGLRGGSVDARNRFTNQDAPDGFGDSPGDLLGVEDQAGSLGAGHPAYFRDGLRQGAIELIALFDQLANGDWSAPAQLDARLSGLSFDPARVGFVGVGSGAAIGLMAVRRHEGISAAVLIGAAGRQLSSWAESPARQHVLRSLLPLVGRADDPFDLVEDPPALWPELSLFQMLIDRADALAHAGGVQRSALNVLALAAAEDEAVHLRQVEELARRLGLSTLGGEPAFVADLPTAASTPGGTIGGNFSVEGTAVTRLFLPLSPAGHEMYASAGSSLAYEHPLRAPYVERAEPLAVDNPIGPLFGHVGLFFESRWACASDPLDNSCAGQVVAP